jgi:Fe-S-cluster-containing dehydrogenase component
MDPYKAANLDEAPLDEKVKDLITFVEKCKFCMMTTHDASSGILVSRCMALAGKVSPPRPSLHS